MRARVPQHVQSVLAVHAHRLDVVPVGENVREVDELAAQGAGFRDDFGCSKGITGTDTAFACAGVGPLDDDAVHERVRVGNADLDHVGAPSLIALDDGAHRVEGMIDGGETQREVADEGRTPLFETVGNDAARLPQTLWILELHRHAPTVKSGSPFNPK